MNSPYVNDYPPQKKEGKEKRKKERLSPCVYLKSSRSNFKINNINQHLEKKDLNEKPSPYEKMSN